MAYISRPFWVRFGDFEFPAALAHFFRFNPGLVCPDDDVSLCHCGNVPQAQARWVVVAAGGGGFMRKSEATGSYNHLQK